MSDEIALADVVGGTETTTETTAEIAPETAAVSEGGAETSPAPVEEAVATPSGETAAPPIDFSSPEIALEIQRLADERFEARFDQLVREAEQHESAEPRGAQLQPGQLPPPPDPIESEDWASEMAAWQQQRDEALIQRFVQAQQQTLAPLLAREHEVTYGEASERIKDIFGDLSSRHGELGELTTPDGKEIDGTQLVRDLADFALPELKQRYGGGPKVAELALEQSYQRVRGMISAAEARGAEKALNKSAAIAGAPTELGVNGAGTLVLSDQGHDELQLGSYSTLARR